MGHCAKLACLFVLLASIPAGWAQPLKVDWKLYGGTPAEGGARATQCFFEAKGIVREANGDIRVWTKCIAQAAMDALDTKSELGKKIIDAAAEKVAHYYVPPFALVEDVNQKQSVDIAASEAFADLAGVEPDATILTEVDCKRGMSRDLQVTIHRNGQMGASDRPGRWDYDPPESNGARLLMLVCMLYRQG